MKLTNPNNKSEKLSTKVSKSTFWFLLCQILDNVLGFIRLLILARLLTPNDFGLIAIGGLVLQTITAFTQTGMHQTLIHKPNISNYLNTAWTYLLFRGIILYLILYICTPLLGVFFNNTDSVSIIRVIGLSLLFEGVTNIGVIYFQKDLIFNKQLIYQIGGNFVDFVVSVGLALLLKDAWAIVYGSTANGLTKVLLSYILSSYRPKFEFKFNIFNELNNYGKWIAGSNLLQFIYSQGDDIMVGRILGSVSLGFYQLAYKISNLPATHITHIVSTIMFPAYSQIQNDQSRISKIYISVLQLTSFLSFFIGTVIICFAHDFTLLFLGEKWLAMVPAMQILTIWGIIRSIGATIGPVWQALGIPKTITKIQTMQAVILLLTIYPLSMVWNISGTSLAVVISAIIPTCIGIHIMSNTIKVNPIKIYKEILIPFIGGLLVAIIFFLMKTFLLSETNYFLFFIFGLGSLITYLLYSIILHKKFNYLIYTNLFSLIKDTSNNRYLLNIVSKFESLIN